MENSNKYRAIQVVAPGKHEIKLIDIPKPGKDQVLVKMAFAPINPSDLLFLAGFYGKEYHPLTIGHEGSGIIVEVGPECVVNHKVGDKVSTYNTLLGTWGEYVLCPSHFAIPILPETTLEEAASHWINPQTVYSMVEDEVKKHGHKAVVHTAGASALGRMMIKSLKKEGIKSINLVRRDDVIQELTNLGADYVINLNDKDFEEKFRKIANEEKATIGFDAVGGDLGGKVIKNMPPGSQLFIYGHLSLKPLEISLMDLIGGKAVKGFLMNEYHSPVASPQERQELGAKLQKGLKDIFHTNVSKTFKFTEVDKAIEFYQANQSQGKVLLDFN